MTGVYEVCAYVPYGNTDVTFALPIFRSKEKDRKFIQMPDVGGLKIQAFEPVDEVREAVPFTKAGSLFKIGVDLQYLLIDQGRIFFGSLSVLRNSFGSLIGRHDIPASVSMQIAELLGDAQGLEKNLDNFLSKVAGNESVYSAQFVSNSVVRNHVWAKLVQHCNINGANDLQGTLKRVLFGVIVSNGKIDLEYSLKKHLSSNLNLNIEKFLLDVNCTFLGGHRLQDVSEILETSQVQEEAVNTKLAEIRNMSRQESRLGRLIKGLIEDDEFGQMVIESYNDRASFANQAIRYIVTFYEQFGKKAWEDYATYIVDWLYRECYPKQRGILLHELAVELGQYPAFARAIESKVLQSYAQPVLHARELIQLQLSHPEERIGRVFAETSNTYPYVERYLDEQDA